MMTLPFCIDLIMTSRKVPATFNCTECGMQRAKNGITWMPGFVVINEKDHLRELPFCRYGCRNSPDDTIQHLCAPLVCKEGPS